MKSAETQTDKDDASEKINDDILVDHGASLGTGPSQDEPNNSIKSL